MITHVTTADVSSLNGMQMGEWAKMAVEVIKEISGTEITIMRNIGGSNNEWHFVVQMESLSALEEYLNKVGSDERFLSVISEAIEQQLWSSSRERLYRTA